jgi:hypothetical protein
MRHVPRRARRLKVAYYLSTALLLSVVFSAESRAQLIAHYAFDGNGNDQTPNAQHARAVGNVTYAPGIRGLAAVLDGNGAHFEIEWGPVLDSLTDELTIVFWLKRGDLPLTESIGVMKRMPWDGNQQVTDWSTHFGVQLSGDGTICVVWSDWQSPVYPGYNLFASTMPVRHILDDGRWHMVAAALKYNSSDQPALFLDGSELRGSYSWFVGNNAAAVRESKLQIGGQPIPAPSSGWFRGLLDEVQIYNRRLTAAQIERLYQEVVPDDGRPPVISDVPADMTVEATNHSGAVVNYTVPSAVDYIHGEVQVQCQPLSGSVFPLGTTVVSCTASDAEGNSVAVRFSVTVQDTMPPSVNCGAVDSGWHQGDVTVLCTATDRGVGLANPADSSFALSTAVPAGAETPSAATGTRTVCDKSGLCTAVGPFTGIMVDKKAPVIAISSPVAGTLVLHQVIAAAYSCADAGSGLVSCVGTLSNGSQLSTAVPGSKTLNVTARDQVGNEAVQSVDYAVAYAVRVLYDEAKAAQSGRTIPIAVQLVDAAGFNASAPDVVVTATGLARISNMAPGIPADSGDANPDGNFRYDEGRYIFNLSTKGLPTGTYRLDFRCGPDPTIHTVRFQVR